MKKTYTNPEMEVILVEPQNVLMISATHEGLGTSSVDVLDELGGSADGSLNDLIDNMLF